MTTVDLCIDTDIPLDLALNRLPHAEVSARVVDWAEEHPGSAAVAWHSLPNIAYMVMGDSRSFLRELLTFAVVPGTSTEAARRALEIPMTDLEDAFQTVAAAGFGADWIVTRNSRDYRRSPVPAVTPKEFLELPD